MSLPHLYVVFKGHQISMLTRHQLLANDGQHMIGHRSHFFIHRREDDGAGSTMSQSGDQWLCCISIGEQCQVLNNNDIRCSQAGHGNHQPMAFMDAEHLSMSSQRSINPTTIEHHEVAQANPLENRGDVVVTKTCSGRTQMLTNGRIHQIGLICNQGDPSTYRWVANVKPVKQNTSRIRITVTSHHLGKGVRRTSPIACQHDQSTKRNLNIACGQRTVRGKR